MNSEILQDQNHEMLQRALESVRSEIATLGKLLRPTLVSGFIYGPGQLVGTSCILHNVTVLSGTPTYVLGTNLVAVYNSLPGQGVGVTTRELMIPFRGELKCLSLSGGTALFVAELL